jgi:hypothetical protein
MQHASQAMLLRWQELDMSTKKAIFGLLVLLSMVAPPVFAAVFVLGMVAAALCNLDIALERWGRRLVERSPAQPKLKLTSSICVVGVLLAVVFFGIGVLWTQTPQISPATIHALLSGGSVVLHFCALFIFLGSMCSFVKLVD